MPTITINGHPHHYREVGQGAPMVCFSSSIHDAVDKQWVGPMPEAQAEQSGYRLIMPDFRGLAGSAHTWDVSPEDWVKDLVSLLDTLSIPSVHISAENLGTRVAVRFAADYPDRVKTLILTASIAVSDDDGDVWRREMQPQLREHLEYFHGDDGPAVLEWYLAFNEREDFKSYFNLLEIAHRITAPTLLIRGDIDTPLHKIAHTMNLHGLIPGSWMCIFPNTAYDARRSHPEEFWNLVRTFIEDRPPPAAAVNLSFVPTKH